MRLYQMVSFFILSFIEAYGGFYFFSAFFKRRLGAVITYVIYAVVLIAVSLSSDAVGGWKLAALDISITLLIKLLYDATWKQVIFFSSMYCSLFWLTDFAFLGIMGSIDAIRNGPAVVVLGMTFLEKIGCILLFVLVKNVFMPAWDLKIYEGIEWYRFMVIPTVVIAYGIYVYRFIRPENVDLEMGITAIVILAADFAFYKLLLDMVLERQRLSEAKLREQKMKSRIEAYKEMEDVLNFQRKKLHDYKNQVSTIGRLISDGSGSEAAKLAMELTESLSADSSIVDTGNAAVNAILNQKYKAAKERGIGMTFLVGDLSELILPSVDVVIILGNLLDNAIAASEGVKESGGNPVIRVTAKEEAHAIFSVKNPVISPVTINDNRVIKKHENGHGTGLLNVWETAEKYDGSFGISCDGKTFTATVII